MSWLLHTTVISEIRKVPRADPGVARWVAGRQDDAWLNPFAGG